MTTKERDRQFKKAFEPLVRLGRLLFAHDPAVLQALTEAEQQTNDLPGNH